jgi:hypothetical protein
MYPFRKKARFCGEDLLAPRPNPKLKDHPFLAVRDCFPPYWRASLKPQTQNVPFRDENNHFIPAQNYVIDKYLSFRETCY